jgi:imidazoleglycerol-phosphate dehydratase
MREAKVNRETTETKIELSLDLDGNIEKSEISTGIGFLDHMLTLFARYAGIELKVTCKGDTWVDDHHSVEDIGITLGKALLSALGDKKGIVRFGEAYQPMDESLVLAALDISGRGGFYTDLKFLTEKTGSFDTELVEEFMKAFATNAGITLHIRQLAGSNSHHIAEAAFKGLGRALRTAVSIDRRFNDKIPSTKGRLG